MQDAINLGYPVNWAAPLNRGLVRWWLALPGQNRAPTIRDLRRSTQLTLTGGVASTPFGRPGGYGSWIFDGVNDYASSAATIDLSTVTKITLAFWLYFNSYANTDKLFLESTTDYNVNRHAILIDPDNSVGSRFDFSLLATTPGGYNGVSITRPSAATWHHYVVTVDRDAGAQQFTNCWVDGKSVTLTQQDTNTANGNFGNFTWYWMTRAGASLWAGGRWDDFRLYSRLLNASEAIALFKESSRGNPTTLNWLERPLLVAEQEAAAAAQQQMTLLGIGA